MKIIKLTVIASLTLPVLLQAEEQASSAIQLEDIAIVEQLDKPAVQTQQESESYESFDPVDSGLSVISEASLDISGQGDIDTTELLKVLPFVQMDMDRFNGDAQSEQDLRPSDFSISGGSYYDNNIMIDGVSVNSVMDVTQSKYNESYDEVNGQTSQTLYVDPSLLQAVEVHDSNISARYGDFAGGVVNYQVRDPKDEFSMSVSAGFQSDEMVNYVGEDSNGDPEPEFMKYRTSISMDLPITEKLKLLVSYSRAESESYYNMSENYNYEDYTNGDVSQNFLLKGIYEVNENLKLTGSVLYSPYESEYTSDDNYDSERLTLSSGFATYLQADGYHHGYDWSSKLSYNQSNNSRDWAGDRYKWDTSTEYGAGLCDNSYCYEGGFGDIDQVQEDFVLELNANRDLYQGTLSFGSEFRYTRARKERLEDSWYYYGYSVDADGGFVCEAGDTTCMDDIAFTDGVLYEAYEADVGVYNHALWSEYQRNIGPVDLRVGVRYSYDDFMENHNFSPRVTSSWEVRPDYFITVGAGRYYASNMLAYAIKAATPATSTYTRDINGDGTLSDWELSTTNTAYDYSQGDLNTPYSDEVSVAFTVPTVLEGNFRIKGVQRWNRDKFATNSEYDENRDRDYTLTNDGKSDYKGVSLEWSGGFAGHAFTANTTWSETTTLGAATDYLSETDIDDMESTYLYFEGDVISEYDLYNIEEQQNYAAPFTAHLGWSTTWFDNKLLTKAALSYRGEYTSIEDSDENIDVDGQSYDVYEETSTDAYTDVSLNAKMEVHRTINTNTVMDLRINNVFNQNPNSESSSYQRGRSIWVGVRVNML